MLIIDGKKVDLTKPETLKGITLKPGGSISVMQNGVTTTLTNQVKPENKQGSLK